MVNSLYIFIVVYFGNLWHDKPMNKEYKFCIKFKGKDYKITVDQSLIMYEYEGVVSDEEILVLKNYLHTEGFVDKNLNYKTL